MDAKLDAFVEDIIRDGVVVLPVLDDRETTLFREAFIGASKKFPEFLHTPEAEECPYVMGGFGAYGCASSFHNAYVRTLRLYTAKRMVHFFRLLAARLDTKNPIRETAPVDPNGKWYFQMLFDRMCLRPKGSNATKEAPHRDLNPQIVTPSANMEEFLPAPYDYAFGGWLNLDEAGRDQAFTCVKKTHRDHITLKKQRGSESGFATVEPKTVVADRVVVPPGHTVVFFQRILHIVTPRKLKYDSYRQFRCWRMTRAVEKPAPLNGWREMLQCVKDFAVPRLPSGQVPPMYSSNHSSSFLFKDSRNDPILWSRKRVRSACFDDEKICKSGANTGKRYKMVRRFMQSLTELGMAAGTRPYHLGEVAFCYPNRQWKIPRNTSLGSVEDILNGKLLKRLEGDCRNMTFVAK